MRKIIITILICIIVIIMPFALAVFYVSNIEGQYYNTFLGAMADKHNRLNSIDEPKIVLIGGSSMPFGINSSLIEEHINMKVVNYGLYAALGSKTMLDLSKSNINEGDIVIFTAEYDKQMYSLYTNPDVMLQTLDSYKKMVFQLPISDWWGLANSYPKFAKEKREFFIQNNAPNPTDVYARSSFNEYGDIIYSRPYNIMTNLYNDNEIINIDSDIIESDFVKYFNDYSKFIKKQKAKLFFSFPPILKDAISEESDEDKRLDFYDYIVKNFDAEVISNIEDYIINKEYFFDSNYHLNDSGVIYRTFLLINDIKRALGITSATNIEIPEGGGAPPLEELIPSDEWDNSQWNCFTYIEENNQIKITGVNELGKVRKKLIIPSVINGVIVTSLSQRALADCSYLEEIRIPYTINKYGNELFSNSNSLIRVYMYFKDYDNIRMPQIGNHFLKEANNELKIYVPNEIVSIAKTDYFWGVYKDRILSY